MTALLLFIPKAIAWILGGVKAAELAFPTIEKFLNLIAGLFTSSTTTPVTPTAIKAPSPTDTTSNQV